MYLFSILLTFCAQVFFIMGCVGTKPDQDSGGKTVGNNDMGNRNQSAHYVKDPTTGSKAVSVVPRRGFGGGVSGRTGRLMERRSVSGNFS